MTPKIVSPLFQPPDPVEVEPVDGLLEDPVEVEPVDGLVEDPLDPLEVCPLPVVAGFHFEL